MPRAALTTFAIFAIGVDPIPMGEFEPMKYAITQGGLLVVCLLLLYWQRQDSKAKHRENSEKITILTSIAERSAVAAERSAQAGEANAQALQRLSHAVENFERRR